MLWYKKIVRFFLLFIIDIDKIYVYYDMYVENIKNDVLINIYFFIVWIMCIVLSYYNKILKYFLFGVEIYEVI